MTEYIGVSGVVNTEQQVELESIFSEVGLVNNRVLQLGVKATHKPQFLMTENRYGREWYPVGDEINHCVTKRDGTQNIAQICFERKFVNDQAYRGEFLRRSLGGAADWLDGVQFDLLPWHRNPDMMGTLIGSDVQQADIPFIDTVILQCQAEIMQELDPQQVRERALGLTGINHILIDSSGGRGMPMQVDQLLPYIDALYGGGLQIAVGGGLDGGLVRSEMPKILKYFPTISWDAEGRLHPVDAKGKRPLDMQACREYIEASAEVLQ